MKNLNVAYWSITGLFCAFMAFSAVPDILMAPDAVTYIANLGYPLYFIPFIGVAKMLGVVALLVPAYPRLKEWAYAGMFFDLIGAAYSVICTEGLQPSSAFIVLPLAFLFSSYYLWHKRKAVASGSTVTA